ncbi:MAG: radical SAM protein [Geobacteraceae bacterium]|nr:radical SAM protein [Geobacteraceae bacterium]
MVEGPVTMKVFIESFGCTRRKLEVTKFHRYFTLNGYEIVKDPKKADYIVVTTCAFKKEEEEHSLSRLDQLGNYRAQMLVYGCLPDIAPAKYRKRFNYDYLSPRNIDEIDSRFSNIRYKFTEIKESNVIPGFINYSHWHDALRKFVTDFEFSTQFFKRVATYACNKVRKNPGSFYLFTSRGCLGNCSYCAIKYAIGRVRSKPVENIVKEFREGILDGYHDFIILGDDVGAYGQDLNGSFPELLSALVNEAYAVAGHGNSVGGKNSRASLHIEEIHPNWVVMFRDQLLDILRSDTIKSILCPVQSGNDRILALMKRRHTAEEILQVLSRIRVVNPKILLTSQIIAGFPTESESDFDDTLQFLKTAHFDEVIVFPYDEKENTEAVKLYPKVPEKTISKRVDKAVNFLVKERISAHLSCQMKLA